MDAEGDAGRAVAHYLSQEGADLAVCQPGAPEFALGSVEEKDLAPLVAGLTLGKVATAVWQDCIERYFPAAPESIGAKLVDRLVRVLEAQSKRAVRAEEAPRRNAIVGALVHALEARPRGVKLSVDQRTRLGEALEALRASKEDVTLLGALFVLLRSAASSYRVSSIGRPGRRARHCRQSHRRDHLSESGRAWWTRWPRRRWRKRRLRRLRWLQRILLRLGEDRRTGVSSGALRVGRDARPKWLDRTARHGRHAWGQRPTRTDHDCRLNPPIGLPMSLLFSPLELRSLNLRNRIMMAPMCQYSARDGIAGDWHRVHYGTRAVGGLGLAIVEMTTIAPEGRISPGCLGLWSDAHAQALAPIARFMKEQGTVPAIQIAHAGRKASVDLAWRGGPLAPAAGGWQTVAPSPIPFADGYPLPRELTQAELEELIEQFVASARRAHQAGFEVVELHMAHGYLMHQFLSPLSNHRTDDYGGSLENRMRFPLAVTRAVRAAWPEHLPLFVRISATDWVEGGWDLAQSITLARELAALGVDLIDCSSAGLLPDVPVPASPGYHGPFSAAIRKETGIATGVVGLITEPQQAEDLLREGAADAVLLGRELLRNPYWPLTAAQTLRDEIPWPNQYLRAKPT